MMTSLRLNCRTLSSRIIPALNLIKSQRQDFQVFYNVSESRSMFTTAPTMIGLKEFRDTMTPENREKETVGRSWSIKELERKSFEDLHKLWYVLYKENNMLLTEDALCVRMGTLSAQPERRRKVKKSLAAIKIVIAGRERENKKG
mmetsp:Transcript_38678/g.39088  ORF Transcript_38678/g.39088 Transcript_38678/m.39088 type:complete len:145 (-) Transcript_38678:491-925(-)